MIITYLFIDNNSDFLNIFGLILPFLLGLFSSFIIDYIRKKIKHRRDKKFVIMFLKEIILPVTSLLKTDYNRVKGRIDDFSRKSLKLNSFVGFNSIVLNGITPVEYYEIFEEKYIILNEIITLINAINQDLPLKLDDKYHSYINTHLERENATADFEHEKDCPTCIQHRDIINGTIQLKIDDVNKLKKEILTLIS